MTDQIEQPVVPEVAPQAPVEVAPEVVAPEVAPVPAFDPAQYVSRSDFEAVQKRFDDLNATSGNYQLQLNTALERQAKQYEAAIEKLGYKLTGTEPPEPDPQLTYQQSLGQRLASYDQYIAQQRRDTAANQLRSAIEGEIAPLKYKFKDQDVSPITPEEVASHIVLAHHSGRGQLTPKQAVAELWNQRQSAMNTYAQANLERFAKENGYVLTKAEAVAAASAAGGAAPVTNSGKAIAPRPGAPAPSKAEPAQQASGNPWARIWNQMVKA